MRLGRPALTTYSRIAPTDQVTKGRGNHGRWDAVPGPATNPPENSGRGEPAQPGTNDTRPEVNGDSVFCCPCALIVNKAPIPPLLHLEGQSPRPTFSSCGSGAIYLVCQAFPALQRRVAATRRGIRAGTEESRLLPFGGNQDSLSPHKQRSGHWVACSSGAEFRVAGEVWLLAGPRCP